MSPTATRRLLALHRWCGLLVSANLLVLTLTGLILVFHDEIDDALGVVPQASNGVAQISLARALELAQTPNPRAKPVFLFQDQEEHPGLLFVGLSEGARRLDDAKPVAVDLRNGKLFEKLDFDGTFTGIVLKLHAELFAGPIGRILVGLVALAFLISLLSGAIVYGPLMKKFAFGLVRRDKAARTRFADLHKLFGAATLGWTFVVAGTGLMLSVGSLLLQYYSVTELAALGKPYANEPVVTDLSTIDRAVQQAGASSLGAVGRSSLCPAPIWRARATTPCSCKAHRNRGARADHGVDAKDPAQSQVHSLPVYLRALLLSEPLHFGNYGGLPLKIVWTLFGLATLGLSASGVWSFWSGRRESRT